MKHIRCAGSPYEIGRQHGQQAKAEVHGSLTFYREFFQQRASLSWPQAQDVARKFLPTVTGWYPDYVEEMQGLADGAEVDLESIAALNVRTEIVFGMMSDGCTTVSWQTPDASFLAQNWDWNFEQGPNVICVLLEQAGKPRIHMMTEAGIIGKIGLNSAGVGVSLNAIQAPGVSYEALPCHLALRTALNSPSREAAVQALRRSRVASACHITVVDAATGGVGVECTAADLVEIAMDARGQTTHSNHLIVPHKVASDRMLGDSPFRLDRIRELTGRLDRPTMENLGAVLKDEANYPSAICRAIGEKSAIQTLFSIVMDLTNRTAHVKMGRPTAEGDEFELKP